MPTRLPRVNIVVTEEQHALLSELAALDPSTPSAAGFVRQLLDQVTPLLRTTVPLMRAASQEMDSSREQLREPLRDFLASMAQHDLLDAPHSPHGTAAKRGPERTARRARGRQ